MTAWGRIDILVKQCPGSCATKSFAKNGQLADFRAVCRTCTFIGGGDLHQGVWEIMRQRRTTARLCI